MFFCKFWNMWFCTHMAHIFKNMCHMGAKSHMPQCAEKYFMTFLVCRILQECLWSKRFPILLQKCQYYAEIAHISILSQHDVVAEISTGNKIYDFENLSLRCLFCTMIHANRLKTWGARLFLPKKAISAKTCSFSRFSGNMSHFGKNLSLSVTIALPPVL